MNFALSTIALLAALAAPLPLDSGDVEVLRLPRGAKHPTAVVDGEGTVHVVYFKPGGKGKGDLFYVKRASDADSWSKPVQVNTRAEGGPLASVAIGEKGRVHVVWMQMAPHEFWYARSTDAGAKFLKEKGVLTKGADGIEAPPSVAADGQGNVAIIWHEGDFKKEDKRVVWMRRSENGGKSFDRGKPVSPKDSGVCACCRQAMATGTDGKLYIIFRAAQDKVDRDMVLLTSTDFGKTYTAETFDKWNLNRCPTQAGSIAAGPSGQTAVLWRNKDETKFAPIGNLSEAIGAPGGKAARSSLAINEQGEMLLVQVAGQQSNQMLRWQVYSPDGKPTDQRGQQKLEERTMPTGVALPGGKFALIY